MMGRRQSTLAFMTVAVCFLVSALVADAVALKVANWIFAVVSAMAVIVMMRRT